LRDGIRGQIHLGNKLAYAKKTREPMVRDVNKLINMEIMEHPEDGISAKREIILAFRLPLVLDLGLYI
jgi:hypothetical protein